MLVVFETHPVQYHAPIYRMLQEKFNVPVHVVYGSSFSVTGYKDEGFKTRFAWDTDLMSGYPSTCLSKFPEKQISWRISSGKLGKVLCGIKPSAALILGYYPFFYWKVHAQAHKVRIPVLFRGETNDHKKPRTLIEKYLRNRLLRWFYQYCDRLLYIGHHSFSHFKALGCEQAKLFFSPYSVDHHSFQWMEKDREKLRAETRLRLGIPDDVQLVLFSGKLCVRKRPEMVIEAVSCLSQKIKSNLAVLFVGDGELRPKLKQMAEAMKVKCLFVGFQNQTQLSPYYHASDLLILPSRYETWGLVVNEALHHGVPCVVSKSVGCAPDLIEPGSTGEVFETDVEASLTNALEKAFNLVGRSEIRTACRKKMEGYTIEKAAQGIAAAYVSLRDR